LGTAVWLPLLLIGFFLGTGMLVSLAHLGSRRNAWRALTNLRRSWLSREVLFTGLFGAGWLFTFLERAIWQRNTVEWLALTATFGLGLIYSMSKVYRLPGIPAWNTWKTNLVFMVSTLLLGHSMLIVLLPHRSTLSNSFLPILLLAQLSLMDKPFSQAPSHLIRTGLIFAGMTLSIVALFPGDAAYPWLSLLTFLTVLAEESLGRWSFYQAVRKPFASS
jgi:DMSO reductase anchor subunit